MKFIKNSNHNGNKYENCQFIFNAAPTQEMLLEKCGAVRTRTERRPMDQDERLGDEPSPKNNSSIREINGGSFGDARESLKKSLNGSAARARARVRARPSLDSMISPRK